MPGHHHLVQVQPLATPAANRRNPHMSKELSNIGAGFTARPETLKEANELC